MPIPMDTQYGLDYGAAPLDMEAARRNALAKGKPLSQGTLDYAAGVNQPTGATTSPDPVSSALSSLPSSAGDPFDTPYFRALGYESFEPKNAGDIMGALTARGMPIGGAYNQIEAMKGAGAIPKDMPGLSDLESNMPGAVSTFANVAAREAMRLPVYMGSWLPGQLGQNFSKASDDLDKQLDDYPPGWSKALGRLTGVVLDAKLMGPLAEATAGAVTPRLPFLAKDVEDIMGTIDSGAPLTSGGVQQVAPAIARINMWKEGIKQGIQWGGSAALRGEGPVSVGITTVFPAVGGLLTKFGPIGRVASRLILGSGAQGDALDFLSGQSGVPKEVLASRINDTDTMFKTLVAMKAPPELMQQMYKSGTEAEFGDQFAKYVGGKAAEWRLNPDQLQDMTKFTPKYQEQTLKEYDEALGGLRGEATNIRPGPVPTKTFNVVETPVDRGGLDTYFSPLSQWAQTRKAIGPEVTGTGLTQEAQDLLKSVDEGEKPFVGFGGVPGEPPDVKLREAGMANLRESMVAQGWSEDKINETLAKYPSSGGKAAIPAFVSRNFRRILEENGVPEEEIANKKPAELIEALRAKGNVGLGGGGDKIIEKEFTNPLTVQFGYMPNSKLMEHPVDAMLRQQTGKLAEEASFLGWKAAQVYTTNGKIYNDVMYNLAAKMATNGGYGSIYFRGPNPTADFVMDLSKYDPGTDLGGLSKIIENRISGAASTLWDGIPSWMGVVGGASLIGAAAGIGSTALTPQESDAGMINIESLRAMAEELGAGESLTRLFNKLSNTGDRTSTMALNYVADHYPIFRATDAVDKLAELQGIIKANPDAPLIFKTAVSNDPVALPGSGRKVVDLQAFHPDVDIPVANVTSYYNNGKLENSSIEGFAPGLIGYTQVKEGLKSINRALKGAGETGVGGVSDTGRITGVAQQSFQAGGAGARTSQFNIRNLGVPLAVGMGAGALYGAHRADGQLIPPEAVGKIISEGFDEGFPALVEASRPTAQLMKMIQIKAPAATGEEMVDKYEDLLDNLKTGDNLTVHALGTPGEPTGLFGISHPTTDPWYLATMHGSIDPDTGTWYADMSQAKDFGFGQGALNKIVDQVKTLNPDIVKLGGKLVGLAGLSAAMYGIYDQFAPAKAQAIEIGPIEEFFGEGLKGAGDDLLNAYAGAAKGADATAKVIDLTQEQMRNSQAVNAGQVYDTAGEKMQANMMASGPTDPDVKHGMGLLQFNNGLKGLPAFRPQFDMTDNAAFQMFSGGFTRKYDAMIGSSNSVRNNLLKGMRDEILPQFDNTPENAFEFIRASRGLRMGEDGVVTQTEANIAPEIDQAAKDYEEWVNRPSFELSKRVKVQAHAIAAKYGLEDEENTWRVLRQIQDRPYDPISDPESQYFQGRRVKASEIAAAGETKGMFGDWDGGENLDLKYKSGYFLFNPVENQRAVLTDQIKSLTTSFEGRQMPPKFQDTLQVMQGYLDQLNSEAAEQFTKRGPLRDTLATSQYFGPLSATSVDKIPPEVAAMLRETDLAKLMKYQITGITRKLFWDDQLTKARKLAAMFEHGFPSMNSPLGAIDKDGAIADQIITNMNTYRGLASVWEDRGVAHIMTSVAGKVGSGKIFTSQEARNAIEGVMNWNYVTKLGGIRFPAVVSTQPALTTSAIGLRHLGIGYSTAINDWQGSLMRAEEQNLLLTSGGPGELVEDNPGWAAKLAKMTGWAPTWIHNANRVISNEAGISYAMEHMAAGDFKIPSWVKHFDESLMDGTHSPQEVAAGFGAALTRTTQFIPSAEGRPLMFSKGGLWRLAGQFKGFAVNHAIFLNNLMKHGAQTGEWGPFLRAMSGLVTLGGGTSAAAIMPFGLTGLAGFNIYDAVRTELIKHGIALPRGSALGAVVDWASGGDGQLEGSPAISQALNMVQMGSALDPVHWPTDPARVLPWALGPTMGTGYELAGSLGKTITGKQGLLDLGKDTARAVFGPLAATIPEAAQEAGLFGSFFDSIGYRGGAYSPQGRALAGQPGDASILGRAVNMQPGIRYGRYQYLNDIQAAMEGNQTDLMRKYLDQAHAAGFIIGPKDVGYLRSQINAARNRQLRPNAPLQ